MGHRVSNSTGVVTHLANLPTHWPENPSWNLVHKHIQNQSVNSQTESETADAGSYLVDIVEPAETLDRWHAPLSHPARSQATKKKKTWCPARACGCVYVQEACLEKRQKQMPVGSQQGCRHWPHFHPNVNTRQSVWLQNKHATCAEGISAVTALW